MSKLTKAQLFDENVTLRAQYEVLLTKYNDLVARNAERDAQLHAPAHSAPRAANSHYERLIKAGMPRKFAYGREVIPSTDQLAYWTQRLSAH